MNVGRLRVRRVDDIGLLGCCGGVLGLRLGLAGLLAQLGDLGLELTQARIDSGGVRSCARRRRRGDQSKGGNH